MSDLLVHVCWLLACVAFGYRMQRHYARKRRRSPRVDPERIAALEKELGYTFTGWRENWQWDDVLRKYVPCEHETKSEVRHPAGRIVDDCDTCARQWDKGADPDACPSSVWFDRALSAAYISYCPHTEITEIHSTRGHVWDQCENCGATYNRQRKTWDGGPSVWV